MSDRQGGGRAGRSPGREPERLTDTTARNTGLDPEKLIRMAASLDRQPAGDPPGDAPPEAGQRGPLAQTGGRTRGRGESIGSLWGSQLGCQQKLVDLVAHCLRLSEALEWLSRHVHRLYGLRVRVSLGADICLLNLDRDRRAFVFHAVRELLVNVVKHVGTDQVRLTIRRRSRLVVVTIDDESVPGGRWLVTLRYPLGPPGRQLPAGRSSRSGQTPQGPGHRSPVIPVPGRRSSRPAGRSAAGRCPPPP